jgi:hypothetical protein
VRIDGAASRRTGADKDRNTTRGLAPVAQGFSLAP